MVCFTSVDQSSVVLQTMFATKKHMDVSFLAGPDKKIVQAHRSVLTAALKYFDVMLSSPFKESTDSTIILHKIDSEILESIIKFLYCGEIDIPDMDTAFQLWEPSHMMEIKNLQDHILQYMKNNITTNNCLGVYLLAKKYEEEELTSLSMRVAVANMEVVIEENEFLHLDKDNLIECIKDAKEKEVYEDTIVKAALTWLNCNKQRQDHLREIIHLLEIEEIVDLSLIDDLEAMCTEVDLIKLITNALKKRCSSGRNLSLRKNHPTKEIIVLIQNYGTTKTITEFDVSSNTILGEADVNFNGTVLGIWKRSLILLQNDWGQLKISRYHIKIEASTNIGDYKIEEYLETTILDDKLYIVTIDHCYIINLTSGHLLNSLDPPPTYKFRGVTSNKEDLYFILYKPDRRCLYVAEYNMESKLIEPLGNAFGNVLHEYIKCMGHNDFIYVFTHHRVIFFNLVTKQWGHASSLPFLGYMGDYSVSDAASSKNKLIVIQNNTLRELSSDYKFIKLQNPFSSLKNRSQLFSL